MNDQETLENIIISLKHLKSFFNTFSQEASNDDIYQCADNSYIEISILQRKCFDLMVELKYMKVSNQSQAAIEKEYKKYENKEC